MPQPHIVFVLLEAKTQADHEQMQVALARLGQEDPRLKVRFDDESGQTIVSGMSELQLEAAVDRLQREQKVKFNVGRPRVVFREAIRTQAEGEGRYIRQTSGWGEYGHVKLRLEPNERGKGYAFRNESRGGVVPLGYIRAIELGIQEGMQGGVLGGYEMVDIKVALYDGSFHDLYSNDVAFRIAGSMAFKEAARKAKPVLLEPIMSVEVTSPEEYAGAIIDDLHSRRGCVARVEVTGSEHVIQAAAPLAEVLGYAIALRGLSQGRARCLMEFKRYEASRDEGDDCGEEPLGIPAGPQQPSPGRPNLQIVRAEPDVLP